MVAVVILRVHSSSSSVDNSDENDDDNIWWWYKQPGMEVPHVGDGRNHVLHSRKYMFDNLSRDRRGRQTFDLNERRIGMPARNIRLLKTNCPIGGSVSASLWSLAARHGGE